MIDDTLADIPPKDPVANLRWRREVVRWGWESEEASDELWEMCRRSLRFFVNGFGWTYDPRRKPSVIPMVLYPFQVDAIEAIDEAIETPHDLVIEKSRDMGASWLVLYPFVWRWLFNEDQTFLCASRNESYVDDAGNPKSLFWKIDKIINSLPNWMLPGAGKGFTRTFARLENHENGCTINGESSTENLARGDRRTALLVDEFAAYDQQAGWAVASATRDSARCRIFNSTLGIVPGAFESIANNPDFPKITLHWSQHPLKTVGLYTSPTGKIRSAWYDAECKRCATDMEIARELDIDYSAAAGLFFKHETLNRVMRSVRSPTSTGKVLHVEGQYGGFERGPGTAALWRDPDAAGRFPADRNYILGVDISTGTGASNSVITVFDRATGEQVMELCDPMIWTHDLASLACAVGRMFGGYDGEAQMVFENVGPGLTFGQLCWKYGYRRFYYRRRDNQHSRPQTDFIGLFQNKEEKIRHFNMLRMMLDHDRMLVRSAIAVSECREIIYATDGGINHKGAQGLDPSGAKTNHGDRASAMAFVATAMQDGVTPGGTISNTSKVLGSFGRDFMARQKARDAKARELEESWL